MRSDEELERRYRTLLRAYPRGYHEHRGEEMLATLMETARPGQTRPDRRDVAEILRGALRERLGMHCAPGLVAGFRIAGPVGLAVAAAFSIGSWALNPRESGFAIAAGLWAVAAVSYVAVPRLLGATIAAAWVGTIAAAATVGLRPGRRLITLPYGEDAQLVFVAEARVQYALTITCGLIALLSVLVVHWRQSIVDRLGLAAGVGLAVYDTLLVRTGAIGAQFNWTGAIRTLPVVVLVAGLAVAAIRRSTAVLWAGLLLLVPMPLIARGAADPTMITVGFLNGPDAIVAAAPMPRLGVTGTSWLVLALALGAAFVVAVAVADGYRRSKVPRDGRAALTRVSGLALGFVGAICAYQLADSAYHGKLAFGPGNLLALMAPVMAAVAVPLLPGRLRRPVLVVVVAGVLTVTYAQWVTVATAEMVVVVTLLLIIAMGEVGSSARLIGVGAAGALVLTASLTWFMPGTSPVTTTVWRQLITSRPSPEW